MNSTAKSSSLTYLDKLKSASLSGITLTLLPKATAESLLRDLFCSAYLRDVIAATASEAGDSTSLTVEISSSTN